MPQDRSKFWFYASFVLFVFLVIAVLILPPAGPLSITAREDSGPDALTGNSGVAQSPLSLQNSPQPLPPGAGGDRGDGGAAAEPVAPDLTPLPGPPQDSSRVGEGAAAEPAAPELTSLPGTPQDLPSQVEPTGTASTTGPPPLDFANATVDELILATESNQWKTRWDAVNALGNLKDPTAVPALAARALRDDNPHPRWRSLWALKSVDSQGARAIPLLREGLESAEPVEVRNAAVALAFYSQPDAQTELLNGLEDSDPWRRWEAVFSLKNMGDSEAALAIATLLDAGFEPDIRTRQETALTLGQIGDESSIPPLMTALNSDPAAAVRWRAALALSRLGNAAALPGLNTALDSELDADVREHIADAIAKLGG
jgi:HEAT repeat protein